MRGEFLFPTDVVINPIDSTVFVADQKLQHPEKNIVNTFLSSQAPISTQASVSSQAPVSDLVADQPQLIIDLEMEDPSMSPGSSQTVEASVSATNSTEQIIDEAIVDLIVFDPSGNIVTEASDDDGSVSEDLAIDFDSEAGEYTIEVQATAEGYASATTSETFEIAG